ncbi:thioredoxin domain-containing protein [Methylocystis parvus]|uniref:thioredoxin domain-containing protein n=1 Tax=Methylocystis parvus TaxID=134 RepID=UPI003C77AE74
MSFPIFAFSRRRLISFAAGALVLAACPGFAGDKAPAGKVPVEELMAPNALPDIVEGNANAPVTIVEYASMTCSHCAAFHKDVYPTLKKDYVDTGKVKFILREFPLDPLATAAFMVARELGDKREAAVDLLFAQQKNWAFVDNPLDGLANVLKQTGIGQDKFDAVLKDKALYEKVNAVRTRANEKFGVNSTPTFFVNGDKYTGEISVADLGKIIAAHTPAN